MCCHTPDDSVCILARPIARVWSYHKLSARYPVDYLSYQLPEVWFRLFRKCVEHLKLFSWEDRKAHVGDIQAISQGNGRNEPFFDV